MRQHAASHEDRPASLAPAPVPAMPWRVRGVRVLDDYALHVTFNDGSAGTVYMRAFIESPGAGVFAALADPEVFAQAHLVFGAVTWADEIDLAPDEMHAQINQHGQWVLGSRTAD